ncbi:hypothetical protein NPIL_567301 [Nephila pilipes]|uniref:Uncharacterized protein n=1 Tax=Nephila pilipes TaxID=299642 RepID=A0A8X6P1D9_NEPPI|nr:hypothetical protein NPIL_567301 [Nephila pilipes]
MDIKHNSLICLTSTNQLSYLSNPGTVQDWEQPLIIKRSQLKCTGSILEHLKSIISYHISLVTIRPVSSKELTSQALVTLSWDREQNCHIILSTILSEIPSHCQPLIYPIQGYPITISTVNASQFHLHRQCPCSIS